MCYEFSNLDFSTFIAKFQLFRKIYIFFSIIIIRFIKMSFIEIGMSLDSILQNIDTVKKRIDNHPELSLNIKFRSHESIREQALGHSLRIEGIGSNMKNGFELPKQIRKEYKSSLRRLQYARSYILQNGLRNGTLPKLGSFVEPMSNTISYRNSNVMFGGFEGVEPGIIHYKIDDLLYRLYDTNTKLHPVTRAIDFHLSFIQIHPFVDGNGRIARLCQDTFLEMEGYAPPIIREEEREFYIDLMEKSMIDRMNGSLVFNMGEGEKQLHKYIGTKVLTSLSDIERNSIEQRGYEILLKNNSPENIRRTISSTRNKLRGQDIFAQIRKIKGGFTVIGDVSFHRINALLNTSKKSSPIKNISALTI